MFTWPGTSGTAAPTCSPVKLDKLTKVGEIYKRLLIQCDHAPGPQYSSLIRLLVVRSLMQHSPVCLNVKLDKLTKVGGIFNRLFILYHHTPGPQYSNLITLLVVVVLLFSLTSFDIDRLLGSTCRNLIFNKFNAGQLLNCLIYTHFLV